MRTHGRITAEERVVVSLQDYRSEAPAELTAEQADEWQAIVKRMPGNWFTRETHPLLVQYSRSDVVPIVGVDYKYANNDSDEQSAAKQLLSELGIPYSQVIYDHDGSTSIDYGVYGAPESFLIDKDGVIRFKQIGPITEDVWNKKIVPLARKLNQ